MLRGSGLVGLRSRFVPLPLIPKLCATPAYGALPQTKLWHLNAEQKAPSECSNELNLAFFLFTINAANAAASALGNKPPSMQPKRVTQALAIGE